MNGKIVPKSGNLHMRAAEQDWSFPVRKKCLPAWFVQGVSVDAFSPKRCQRSGELWPVLVASVADDDDQQRELANTLQVFHDSPDVTHLIGGVTNYSSKALCSAHVLPVAELRLMVAA